MSKDPGWSNDWWGRDPIEEIEPEDDEEEPHLSLDELAERIREADAQSYAHIRNWIELLRMMK